jgi:hypothetical protein
MHQLIRASPRRFRWTTISAAVSSGMFTQREPRSCGTRRQASSQAYVKER